MKSAEERYLDELLQSVMGGPAKPIELAPDYDIASAHTPKTKPEPEKEPEVEELVVSEEKTEAVPEIEEVLPEEAEAVPEIEEVLPEEAETVPEIEEVLPEEAEAVPEIEEVLPEEAEVVPEESNLLQIDNIAAMLDEAISDQSMEAEIPQIIPEEDLIIGSDGELSSLFDTAMAVAAEDGIIGVEEETLPEMEEEQPLLMPEEELPLEMEEELPLSMPEEEIPLPIEADEVPVISEEDFAEAGTDEISALLGDIAELMPEDEVLAESEEEMPLLMPEEELLPEMEEEQPLLMPEEEFLPEMEEEQPLLMPEEELPLEMEEELPLSMPEEEILPEMEEEQPLLMPEEEIPLTTETEEDIFSLLDSAMADVSEEDLAAFDKEETAEVSGDSLALDGVSSLTEDAIDSMLKEASAVSEDTVEIPDVSADDSSADLFDMLQKSDEHELIDEGQIALSEQLDQLDLQADVPDLLDMERLGEEDMAELLDNVSKDSRLDAENAKEEKARKKAEEKEKKRQEKELRKQEKERRKQEKKAGGSGSLFARFKKKPKEESEISASDQQNADDSFESSIKELLGDDASGDEVSQGDSILPDVSETEEHPFALDDTLSDGTEISPLDTISEEEALSLGAEFDLSEETLDILKGNEGDGGADEPLVLTEAEATLAIRDRNEPDGDGAAKGKKKGIFSRLMEFLTESDDEEEEGEKELPTGKVSAENQAILDELDADSGKKGKGKKEKKKKEKKEKKGKKGKAGDDEDGEESKDKKKKKEKVKKEKKVKEPTDETPQKRLPRKKVKAAILFSATILVVLLIFCLLLPSILAVKQAKDAYKAGRYETAYQNLYGKKKLSAADQELFKKSELIMKMQRKWKSYKAYIEMDKPLEALDALIQGVARYQEMEEEATALGVSGKMGKYYKKMLNILHTDYNVTEAEAILITEIPDDRDYTQALQNVLDGLKYNAASDTDYREKLEPLVDDIPDEELEEEPEPEEQGNVLFEIFSK